LGAECFVFFKIKPLVDQYASYFSRHQDFKPQRVFELGIWDGGSIAFWFELFHPLKHVAVDLAPKKDSAYFERYVSSRGLESRITTFWQTDQSDKARLQQIAREQFGAPLDLVIDDASHLYGPTKASFEALFPLVRPGGLYIIEDWAWDHWGEFQSTSHPWANETALTRFIFDVVEVAGGSTQLISSLSVCQGFAVVERGPDVDLRAEDFSLDSYISRRPPLPRLVRWRRELGALKRQLVSGPKWGAK
jgi:hypothetical protein